MVGAQSIHYIGIMQFQNISTVLLGSSLVLALVACGSGSSGDPFIGTGGTSGGGGTSGSAGTGGLGTGGTGAVVGTGGSSGVDYLDKAAQGRIFPELWGVRTLLLPVAELPKLENPSFYDFAV